MKKVIVLLMAMVILISGCGNGATEEGKNASENKETTENKDTNEAGAEDDSFYSEVGEFPITKEKITLTVGMPQHPLITDYNDNILTKLIEDKTGVDLEFIMFPATKGNEHLTKFNAMVASGERLPDILLGFNFSDVDLYTMAKNGIFMDMTDMYDTQAYYLKAAIEETSEHGNDMVQLMTSPDGKIYTMPKMAEQLGNEFSARGWINQVWLDNLGLDYPTTLDEYVEVLRAFKEEDANGNGDPNDEIPMMGANSGWRTKVQDWLMNSFIYNDSLSGWRVVDGQLDLIYDNDEWKAGIAFMDQLYDEGLLPDVVFSQSVQDYRAIAQKGDISIIGSYFSGGFVYPTVGDERVNEYVPLKPLIGPEGQAFAQYFPSVPKNAGQISTFCEYPEAAFRVMDYMMSEEFSLSGRYGVLGEDWDYASGDKPGIFEETLGLKATVVDINQIWGETHNRHWRAEQPSYISYKFSDGKEDVGDPTWFEARIAQQAPLYVDFKPEDGTYVKELIYNKEENDQIAEPKTLIYDFAYESLARFIIGDLDIDKDWDWYVGELHAMGMDEYIEVSQVVYDRMYK